MCLGGRCAAGIVRDERLRGGNLVHDQVGVRQLDRLVDLGRLMARFHDEPVVLRAYALVDRERDVGMRPDTRWSAAEVFELAGREDEAKALLEESVEIAEVPTPGCSRKVRKRPATLTGE